MASIPKPSARERRLSELLEEQQEPFLLDVYLLEHGYSIRFLRSKASSLCWPGSTCKRLLRLSSHGLRRRGGFLRCMLNKLVYGKLIQKGINWENIWDSISHGSGRLSFSDCFFYMGRRTNDLEFKQFSCSGDVSVELDTQLQWKCMEESEQLSPVSVLELHSAEGSADCSNIEDEISSTSSPNAEEASRIFEELLNYVYRSPLPQWNKTKSKADQSEQLMKDCVKEVEMKTQDSGGGLNAGSLEKIINEQILSWEKQKANINSVTQLIEVDFSSSRKEWTHFQPEIREIGIEIEGIIFDEIGAEIISDMLDFHCTVHGKDVDDYI